MNRSSSTATVSALVFLSTLSLAQEVEAPRRRSLVFYLMDTTRHDRVGLDGYERDTTPFLDRLAERSVVFEACYTQAPWTKPSMASMLTSQYPSTTGIYRMEQRLADDFVTWPEVLQANGYFTAGFSTNIVMGNTLSNFAQGFTHFTEGTLINEGDAIRFASGSAKKLNQHAFAWLEENDPWPMLLYLHSVDPHEEYEPAAPYLEKFADPKRDPRFREEWKQLLASRPEIPGLYVTQDNFDATGIDSASFLSHASDLYDADILANDDQIEALWNRLEEEGWGEDFVFVFTSDHGEEFFEHGGTSHGYSLYDEMIRVPLMIYAPGLVPGGKRIDTPVRSLDIYPTLCELLGIAPPEGIQGTSLVPLMRGEAPTTATEIFSEHREDPVLRHIGQASGVLVSLRLGRWKFILNETPSQLIERPRFELYDVVEDPREQKNLAERYPDVVKWLEPKVVTFIAKHRAGAKISDWVVADPEVLEQLRALGYVGDEDKPDVWTALGTNDLAELRKALAAGADPDQQQEEFGLVPLSMVAMRGDVEAAEILLDAGADVNGLGRDRTTPILSAVFLGRVDVMELLLENGADPSIRNERNERPLDVIWSPWDATEFIASLFSIDLDRGAVEEGRKVCYERLAALEESVVTPQMELFQAIARGSLEDVKACLADGADLQTLDAETGWTPLAATVFQGRAALTAHFLASGADVNAKNRDGGTSLHGAALLGDHAAIELLVKSGAGVDTPDGTGGTPLHSAAFLGRVDAVAALLDAGADPACKNQDGSTPLEVSRTGWEITAYVIRLLGLDLERAEVEEGRAAVAELLTE